jgi:hypothetical protein
MQIKRSYRTWFSASSFSPGGITQTPEMPNFYFSLFLLAKNVEAAILNLAIWRLFANE